MKKNVVWWIGVKNDLYSEKYGGWEWMDISRRTWEYWCKKNDVLFVPFEQPVETDLTKFRINWQKAIFVFDELDKRNIEYDQICLIDCTHMIKWDAPNFFKLTDHKFCALRDMDNLKWIYDSIKGYESFFKYKLDIKKYVNSSPMIFNESQKVICNVDTFVELQDKIVKKGTEQTPLNYWLQMNNVDIDLSLPLPFKLTHMNRKELFHYNWQLNDDKTPHFIKHGYDWVFTGFAKDQRSNLMKQTWDIVKHYYDDNFILNRIANKNENKNTTSGKFKEDILKFFSDPKYKNMTMLELGCHMGNTTRIYSECFGKVIAVEKSEHNISVAKETCSDVDNVEFINIDVYDDNFKLPNADIVHIDAGHTYEQVIYDIDRCIEQMDNPIIIMDDYGHEGRTVRDAIDKKLEEGKLILYKHIGEDKGYVASNDKVFIGREGVICNV
jgi:predicted protein tyrosine phosphatase